MAHLRKKKGNYYAEFYDPRRRPARKWVTLRTKDESVAMGRFVKLQKKEALDLYDPWEDPAPHAGMSVLEAVKRFLKERERLGLRKKTIKTYRYTLEMWEHHIPPALPIEHVGAKHIDSFLGRKVSPRTKKPVSPTTKDTYYRQLRTFFRWCTEEGIVPRNPMSAVARPQKPEKPAAFLMPAEVETLLAKIKEAAPKTSKSKRSRRVVWLLDVIRFAVYTGLRRGELCDLRWGAVHFESGFLTVRSTGDFQTKTGDDDRIPIVAPAAKILRRMRVEYPTDDPEAFVFRGARGGRLYPNYVAERFRYYRDKAGLPKDIHFHSLRHTCASWLVMQGTPLRTVQAMLRHSTIDVTQRYAHLAPEAFKNQIEEAFAGVSEAQKAA